MTALQKLKQKLLFSVLVVNHLDPDVIDREYDKLAEDDQLADGLNDAMSELRCGTAYTNLPCEYSRHYESKAVAAQMADASWVGWTYWYGGGKHGEPEAMDWMEDAYDVTCEEVMMPVKVFKKVEPTS